MSFDSSLFSVTLFRKPKSKIFVLQATMRCLRAITDIQQRGKIFLSSEKLRILQDELKENFQLTVEELTKKNVLPKQSAEFTFEDQYILLSMSQYLITKRSL